MPTLPSYDSSQNVNTPTPVLDQGNQAQAQASAGMSKTVQGVAEQWSRANDLMQYTEAKATYSTRQADILNRASIDPDFKNTKQYSDELEMARTDSLKSISNAEIKEKASVEFDSSNSIAGIKIGAYAKAKQVKYHKFTVGKTIESKLQLRGRSELGGVEAEIIEEEVKTLLDASVATGTLDYEEADEMLQKFRKTAVTLDISTEVVTEIADSQVYEELKKGDKGAYKMLTDMQRNAAMKDLKTKISDNKSTLKKTVENDEIVSLQNQLNNQNGFSERISSGEMPLEEAMRELDAGVFAGNFSKDWAEAKKKEILTSKGINPTMVDAFEHSMIMKVADLTGVYESKPPKSRNKKDARDYLSGMNRVEIAISNGVAEGKMTKETADGLRAQLNDATTAEATSKAIGGMSWGFQVNDANDAFKRALNVEDRYKAVRMYFNQTNGKDLSDDNKVKIASDIADKLKSETRSQVLDDGDKAIQDIVTKKSSGLKVGTINGGYEFKGGDPKNPGSWEKVK